MEDGFQENISAFLKFTKMLMHAYYVTWIELEVWVFLFKSIMLKAVFLSLGFGVFTKRSYEKGEFLMEYRGK